MKNFIYLLLFFFSMNSFGQTALEWQKFSMEEKIMSKITNTVSKVLKDNQYMVEVEVKFTDPGPPKFEDMNKVGLKVSDIEFDESKGDYIAFSKIGLEVPVIEKYYGDHQQKLKEIHRFNESYNIFKNLDSIDVKVFFSDLLPEAKVLQATKLVQNLKFSVGDVKPKMKFEKLSLETKKVANIAKKKPEDKITLKDIFTWLSEFGNAIGLIVATILFGLFAKKLLSMWEEIMNSLIMKREEINNPLEDEKNEEEDSVASAEEGDHLFEDLESEDFERFRKLFERSKQDATLLIKRWISFGEEKYKMALKAVAQQLRVEDLSVLFTGLSDKEREKWKDSLDQFMSLELINKTNQFISEEVVRSMIGPSQVDDVELIDLLLTLTEETAVSFIDAHPEESKIIMNLLTPQFSGKILDQLDDDKASELIGQSLEFDFSSITDNYSAFKKVLADFIDSKKRKPFSEKIVQMLPDFNPLKESMLYDFLANSGMKTEILYMARQNFPSELIIEMPGTFLKKALQSYEQDQRITLLASLEDDLKNKLINSFAEEGSAAREMLDMEFEDIENNDIAQAQIKIRKDDMWKDFVIHVRSMAKDDDQFSSEVDMLVQQWVNKMTENQAVA